MSEKQFCRKFRDKPISQEEFDALMARTRYNPKNSCSAKKTASTEEVVVAAENLAKISFFHLNKIFSEK